jgi:hypothetical protein
MKNPHKNTKKRPTGGSERARAGLDSGVQAKIGEGLRAMYDDVVRQGVPDRFAQLLAKLDEDGGNGQGIEDGFQEK